jgi:DNA-binding XRE family transcriptional regulator
MTNSPRDREDKEISLHSKEIQKIFSNIRKIRMMKGYSQQNVADELGINQKHYSKTLLSKMFFDTM